MNTLIFTSKPEIATLPGGWEPAQVPRLNSAAVASELRNHSMTIIEGLFSDNDCQQLIDLFHQTPQLRPVSVQGNPISGDEITGSLRANIWSTALAEQLWQKLKHHIYPRTMNKYTSTDWWQGNKQRRDWLPVKCSPLFRFMQYNCGGKHLPHYDAGFIYSDDSLRTLQSVVIYLTTSKKGGATRAIADQQDNKPIWHRHHGDWEREANPTEVICQANAIAGNTLVFDHRVCHDVEIHEDLEPRIIIRTDIIFTANSHWQRNR